MTLPVWTTYGGTSLFRLADGAAYTFKTSHMALDADGSPRAYHPDNTGLDDNRNGGYPNGGWRSVMAVDPKDPSRPYVQTSGPTAGYFVAKTSLLDPTKAATDPACYVDSETIPYLVFPGAFRKMAGTGDLGDLVMARRLNSTSEGAAIVADVGPSKAPLGEVSLKLAVDLGGHNPNPRNGAGAPSGVFQYVVFPRSRTRPAWPRTAAELQAAARALLQAAGGWPAI